MIALPVVSPRERFRHHASSAKHFGRAARVDGSARLTGDCGDAVEFSLSVENGRIAEIRFTPHGCAYTRSCASAASTLAEGRTLEEALEIDPAAVEAELGGLPQDHLHCARLAVNTLGEAVADCIGRAGK